MVTASQTKNQNIRSDTRGSVVDGYRITVVGALVNALLILAKLVAGFLGNSHALIADAVHSISDFVTDVIVLVGLYIGRKAPDDTHPFGHGRIETLASALVGVCLVAAGAVLGFDAALLIDHNTATSPTWLALVGALVSIVLKEFLYQYTVRVGRRIHSQVVVANAWHHRSDALSSIAVLIGVGATLIEPAWSSLDAWAAIFVSAIVIRVGLQIAWKAFKEMVDTAPSGEEQDEILDCVRSVEGVEQAHDLKIRSSAGMFLIQVHIEVDGDMSVHQGHAITRKVKECLFTQVDKTAEVIVHVDPLKTSQSND